MSVQIIPAQPKHAEMILESLRDDSALDMQISGWDNNIALKRAIEMSRHSWAGFYDGQIACICGVESRNLIDDQAYLWLLTTNIVEKHYFLFVRYSQIFVQELITHNYNHINGFVRPEFDRSIKWLRFLGFTVETEKMFSKDLLYFHMTRH